MKNIIKILILLIFTSCSSKNTNKEKVINEKIISDSITQNVNSTRISNSEKIEESNKLEETEELDSESEDDCIFDQSTQTDEFLKGIKELQNYNWDSISKTATIILDNGDTLLIERGGCYSFGVSVKFKIQKDTTDYSKWNNVFNKVLWISKILKTEFEYEDIKNELDSNKITIEKYDKSDVVNFSNEYLQNLHYEITRTLGKNSKMIELSYYID